MNHVALKVNKSNAMLSKLRHALDIKTLSSVFYAIFKSYLGFASLVRAQNTNSVKRLPLLQKKSPGIMFFQSRNPYISTLFKMSIIHKSFDMAALENCISIIKSLKGLLPFISSNLLKFFWNHTIMILDGQILVILNYPLTVLKPMVHIQCF